jgi:hypothetical protein
LFNEFISDSEDLEYFSTRTRYPGQVEIEDYNAKKALQQAANIYRFVESQIKTIII